jgi:16S rRNA (guanine966-N2)-methyltransferase
LRIVGGVLGGRRLSAPRSDATRPTTDRVREGLASALDARGALAGARVLDLFAGSGALGFEALSRGAIELVAVDADPRAVECVTANARSLGVAEQTRVLRIELLARPAAAVRRLRTVAGEGFSLGFADAPYDALDAVPPLLEALAREGVFAPGALVAVEHPSRRAPVWPAAFTSVARYRYGDTAVSLLELGGVAASAG